MTLALDLTLLGYPGLRPDGPLFARPNAKLLEEVLHFLFHSYSSSECDLRFRDCWPPTTALLAKQFRVAALRWSEELKRTSAWPRECALRKSWLDESVGERLEECLRGIAEFLVTREATGPSTAESADLTGLMGANAKVYALECYLHDSKWNELGEQLDRTERIKVSLPSPSTEPSKREYSAHRSSNDDTIRDQYTLFTEKILMDAV